MLQAYDQHGQQVNIGLLTKEELYSQRKKKHYCPVCKENVVIKAGNIVLPHFAHLPKSNCLFKEGGEGAYHEQGKWYLYQWLKHQGLPVQMEAYLPNIQQRPDVLLGVNGKKVAIEYQCATMPEKTFLKRNEGYYREGITPIWILGGNRMKRKGEQALALSSSDLLYLHQFSANFPLTLYYFCPSTRYFSSFQDIWLTGTKRSYGRIHFHLLDRLTFVDLFKKESSHRTMMLKNWRKEKVTLRQSYNPYPSRNERKWREWIYTKKTHPSLLPSVVYLPVSHPFLLRSSLWVWQSILILEVIHPLPLQSVFSLNQCLTLLQQHRKSADCYPLIKGPADPVIEYLQLLVTLGYLQEQTHHVFIKKKSMYFPKNIEEANVWDRKLMDVLQYISINKHD